jgi:Family of unknown function (DUF6412)
VIPALTSALSGLPLPGLALPGLAPSGLASSGLLVLAAITLTGMLIALLAHSGRVAASVTAIPQGRRAAALREKSWRAAFLPQRDPDAAGRARPRAPTAVPAAA